MGVYLAKLGQQHLFSWFLLIYALNLNHHLLAVLLNSWHVVSELEFLNLKLQLQIHFCVSLGERKEEGRWCLLHTGVLLVSQGTFHTFGYWMWMTWFRFLWNWSPYILSMSIFLLLPPRYSYWFCLLWSSWHILMRMRAPKEGSCDPIAPLELPHSLHAFHRVSDADEMNVVTL